MKTTVNSAKYLSKVTQKNKKYFSAHEISATLGYRPHLAFV